MEGDETDRPLNFDSLTHLHKVLMLQIVESFSVLEEGFRLVFKLLVKEVSIIIHIIILALQMMKLNHGSVRIHPRPCTELKNNFWALVLLSDY